MHPLRCSCHLFPISYFAPHIPPGKTKTNWIWTKLAPIYIFFYRLGLPREREERWWKKIVARIRGYLQIVARIGRREGGGKPGGGKLYFRQKELLRSKLGRPDLSALAVDFPPSSTVCNWRNSGVCRNRRKSWVVSSSAWIPTNTSSRHRPTSYFGKVVTPPWHGQWHTTRSGDGTELKKENREKQQNLKKIGGNTNLKKELSWRRQIGGSTTIVLIIIIIIIITAITTNIITIMMTIMMSMITMTIMIRIGKNAPTVSCS